MKRNAMVVAHPDDETMWGAKYILDNPGDWTVICCSIPRRDPIRAYKFYDACDVLGAKGRVLPYQETEPSQLFRHMMFDLSDYDMVVTHNLKGEYGHLHHLQVSRYVREHFSGEIIYFDGTFDGRCMDALKCYDHITPYNGRNIPKWEALLERYC